LIRVAFLNSNSVMRSDKRRAFTINGRFLSQTVTGVQRYARQITAHLDDLLSKENSDFRFDAKIVVPPGAGADYRLSSILVEPTRYGRGPLWDQFVLPFHTEGILLNLCNQAPLIVSPQILCIHDVNTLLAPESYSRFFRLYYRQIQPLLARRATRVATVSQFSARMLAKYGFCAFDNIAVIPNGHEHIELWDAGRSAFASRDPHAKPYVFVLGSRARHKNVEMLYAIAQELEALGIEILVAGVGAGKFSDLGDRSVPPNVRHLGFVSDDDLAALYKHALCFAFPSLTEGFGVPALEAMALGCPVIASDIASLHEVCGNAALYADPKSPDQWLKCIQHLGGEPEAAGSLRQRGLVQAKLFSWAKSARAYLDMLGTIQRDAVSA